MIIVIPTHWRVDVLRRTLGSLSECDRPDGFNRTFVVENGPQCGAKEVAEDAASWLNVEYIHHAVANKSEALNEVLKRVGDELIVFFDDDVRFHKGVLNAYANASVRAERNVFFGGPTSVDYDAAPPEWLRDFLPSSAVGWSLGDQDCNVNEPCLLGFNWAAYASHIIAAGGFDSRVGPGGTTGARGQEASMQVKLLGRGVVGRYVAEALVWHYVPTERCTPEWALKRAYQSGTAQGMRDSSQIVTIFGTPRWMIREFLVSAAFAVATFPVGKERSFKARHRLRRIQGRLHGVRLRKKSDSSNKAFAQ